MCVLCKQKPQYSPFGHAILNFSIFLGTEFSVQPNANDLHYCERINTIPVERSTQIDTAAHAAVWTARGAEIESCYLPCCT